MQNLSDKKAKGQVFTPRNVVSYILDLASYSGHNVLEKHVIDNSCGEGAFLTLIVERYIKAAISNGKSVNTIKNELETFIHGIEKDPIIHKNCVKNLDLLSGKYNINNVKWDVICADALDVTKFDGKMSYAFGNPPYIRVHNLSNEYEKIKNYKFAKKGMTDLYIVFYEIGLKMLSSDGILGYITPSSLFNSIAGRDLRKYFVQNNLIKKVVDFKHNQFFDATTYTSIFILSKSNKSDLVKYYEYDSNNDDIVQVDDLKCQDFYINDSFYFSNKRNLNLLKSVLDIENDKKIVEVKNGFATLQDKVFIDNFDQNDFMIPVVKASTGEVKKCFFPYKNGKSVDFDKLPNSIKKYLNDNKSDLVKRSLDKNTKWYEFGRSQGLNDVYKKKYAINSIIRGIDNIRLKLCKSGVGVYGGLYILTNLQEEKLRDIVCSEDFITYIKLLGKYKNSGYYTFSSKELEKYIAYRCGKGTKKYEQLGIFTGN